MSTWSLSFSVCDAAQPEDDGALVLLNDLRHRQEKPQNVELTSKQAAKETVVCALVAFFTHLQTEPDGDGEEED